MTSSNIYEPLKPPINALEIFFLLLVMHSGIMTIFIDPEPTSIEALLGSVWEVVWASALIGGGLLALLGTIWHGRAIVAIGMLEVGLVGLGTASIARAMAIALLGFPENSYVIFSFGLAALIRVIQLEGRLRRSRNIPTWISKMRRR